MSRAVYQKLQNLTMNKRGEIIDLEYPLKGTVGIDTQMSVNHPDGSYRDYYAFGARDVESNNKLMGAPQLYRNGTYQTTFFYGTSSSYWSYATPVNLTTYKIVVPSSGSVQFIGSSTRTTSKQSFSYPNHNIYVFGVHVKDGDKDYVEYNNTGYINYIKLTDNGSLVRDMIPVKRLSDGICGLLDKVSKKLFITKSGNTSCLSGTVVANKYYDSQGNEIDSTESLNEKLENIEETKGLIKEAIISKGVEVSDSDSFRSYVDKINNIQSGGSSDLTITDCSYLFHNKARLNDLDKYLKLCKDVTNMTYMFYKCSDLTNIDLSSFDTSNVTDMSYLFGQCSGIKILDLSTFNTNNVTDMTSMFSGCSSLYDLNLSSFNTSKVTNMKNMFSGCSNSSYRLDLSLFDMNNVTNISYMFQGCSLLVEVILGSSNTGKLTNMSYMFGDCINLTKIDLSNIDTSKAAYMSNLFYRCLNLANIDLSLFDMSSAISIGGIFSNTTALTTVNSFRNLGKGYTQKSNNYSSYKLDLSSTKLNHDSLVDIINNGLYDLNLTYDVANGGTLYTQQLVLGSTLLAKLTAEEIAVATAKGWTVS